MPTYTSSANLLLLACATLASAQYSGYGGGSDPYGGGGGGGGNGNGGNGGNGGSGGDGDGGSNPGSEYGYGGSEYASYPMIITAHAVLATLAFGLLFPVGGIVVRLASFPGLWWIHGMFQLFAYALFTVAFGLGIYLATHLNLLYEYHPIIGIVLFVLLAFQPILGFLHHTMFKRHSRRTVWSYGHVWLGRIIITLGIINGGFGLQLANETHFFAPGNRPIIAYSVVAGVIWLIYMASAIYGERKRAQTGAKEGFVAPPEQKEAGPEPGVRTHYG